MKRACEKGFRGRRPARPGCRARTVGRPGGRRERDDSPWCGRPHTSARDQAMKRRWTWRSEARRQGPPGTATHQHVGDRCAHLLIGNVLRLLPCGRAFAGGSSGSASSHKPPGTIHSRRLLPLPGSASRPPQGTRSRSAGALPGGRHGAGTCGPGPDRRVPGRAVVRRVVGSRWWRGFRVRKRRPGRGG